MLPWRRFQTCVKRYRGDHKVISFFVPGVFSCHGICPNHWTRKYILKTVTKWYFSLGKPANLLPFAVYSISSIALCLNALSSHCYHLRIRSKITKINLAHANNNRNWIKQHLCIKRFFGRSDNAVRSQIWIAMYVYLLILIVKNRLGLEHTAYEILKILSVAIFIKRSLFTLFVNDFTLFDNHYNPNQLLLFDL